MTLSLLCFLAAPALLIDDPLKGGSAGRAAGVGDFLDPQGWQSRGGRLVYDVGRQLESGFIEVRMRGWSTPAAGSAKSHPLSGWETAPPHSQENPSRLAFFNWRIGSNYEVFKFLATAGGDRRREEVVCCQGVSIAPGEAHLYRVAWSSGRVSYYLDNRHLHTFHFPRFQVRYFTVGSDEWYPITKPAPVILSVRAGELPPHPSRGAWGIYDPLNLATSGRFTSRRDNPQPRFANGWLLDREDSQIRYDLGRHYPTGTAEFMIQGPLDQKPKRILFGAWNQKAGADGNRQDQGFLQVRLMGGGAMLRLTRRGGRSFEGLTAPIAWTDGRWRHFRVQWNTRGGINRLWLDGQLIQAGTFPLPFEGLRWLFLGKDNYKPDYLTVQGAKIRYFKVYGLGE